MTRTLLSILLLVSGDLSAARTEQQIHMQVNRERASQGVRILEMDERLAAIARAHSADMARRHFFSHTNPDGEDPTTRGRREGYECRKVSGNLIREGLAENLFEASLPGQALASIVKLSVSSWMDSPGHRRNILERNYSTTGVGIAVSGDIVYITQLFC